MFGLMKSFSTIFSIHHEISSWIERLFLNLLQLWPWFALNMFIILNFDYRLKNTISNWGLDFFFQNFKWWIRVQFQLALLISHFTSSMNIQGFISVLVINCWIVYYQCLIFFFHFSYVDKWLWSWKLEKGNVEMVDFTPALASLFVCLFCHNCL